MFKQDIVSLWWGERLRSGSQLTNAKKHRDNNLLVEVKGDPRWFSRIDTDALWEDHKEWAEASGLTEYLKSTNKNGFMLMFYSTTGATKGRTRHGSRRTVKYVAVFSPKEYHEKYFQSNGTTMPADT